MSEVDHPAHSKGCVWYEGQPCNCGGPEMPVGETVTDQPQTPATEAGRALASNELLLRDYPTIVSRILAIEAEARAEARADFDTLGKNNINYLTGLRDGRNATEGHITALRSALERLEHGRIWHHPEGWGTVEGHWFAQQEDWDHARHVLSDTASAATEEVARIEAQLNADDEALMAQRYEAARVLLKGGSEDRG